MSDEVLPGMPEDTPVTFRERVSSILAVAREDFASTNTYGKAIIASTMLMGAYEWGPGNETVTPIVTGQGLDVANGVGGLALTAAIGGGFVLGQQLFSGFLARRTVEQFPNMGEKVFDYSNEDNESIRFRPFAELPKGKQLLYSFSLGASFLVARESTVTGKSDKEHLVTVSRKSATITASSVALVGASVDLVNQTNEDNSVVQFCKTGVLKILFSGLE